jgi:hypothetical protein
MMSVAPGSTPVQVITTFTVTFEELGTAVQVGAAGGVLSTIKAPVTVCVLGPLTFPEVSVCVAVITVPTERVEARLHSHIPFASTMTGAFVQLVPVIFIIAPISPFPVIVVEVSVIGLMVGAAGAVVSESETVVVAITDIVLPISVCCASMIVPIERVVEMLQVQVPLDATITGLFVHVVLFTVIVEPAIPVPVTYISLLFTGFITGAAETATETLETTTVAGAEIFPATSTAVAETSVPATRVIVSVQE